MSTRESFVRNVLSASTLLVAVTSFLSACGGDPAADVQAVGEHGEHQEGAAHADEVHLAVDSLQRLGVELSEARKQVLVPTQRVPAQVAFNSEGIAHVGVSVRGRVAELRVRLGDEVLPFAEHGRLLSAGRSAGRRLTAVEAIDAQVALLHPRHGALPRQNVLQDGEGHNQLLH